MHSSHAFESWENLDPLINEPVAGSQQLMVQDLTMDLSRMLRDYEFARVMEMKIS